MQTAIIQEIAAKFQQLDREDLEKLFFIIRRILFPNELDHEKFVGDLQESKFAAGLVCPHCSGTNVIKFGHANGRQRYKCKDSERCGKIFSDFTKSPISRSRYPEKWVLFARCMLKSMCLRATAYEVGITLPTAFYWRHKILTALQKLDLKPFKGIVELDEIFFLCSEKGQKHITGRVARKRGGVASRRGISREQVCVLVACDRKGAQTVSKVACTGQITAPSIDRIITPFVGPTTVICTDAAHGYRLYCRNKGIQHVQLKKGKRKQGIYDIQKVSSYHSHLKYWISDFNGVASKYLDNYLTWFGFARKKGAVAVNVKMKDMVIRACVNGLDAGTTWDSIRLSKFTV